MVERRSSVSDQSQAALDLLLETLGSAVAHGARMEPDEVRFGVTSLAMVPPNELPVFINQYTLGVGWDGAPVVVMGTEPAERADSAEDMAWHAVYSALVAAESRSEILDRIVAGSTWQAAAKGDGVQLTTGRITSRPMTSSMLSAAAGARLGRSWPKL